MSELLDWLPLAALASVLCLGIGRALGLYARGVPVVVADRQRSLAQVLADLLSFICLFVWGYEIVAYAWPLRTHLVPSPLGTMIVEGVAIEALGAALIVGGLLSYGLALRAFGASWRIGIDRHAPGALVTHGVFAWTRNPIYVAFDLLAVGTFLVQGRLAFLALALIIVGMLHGQIRREERFLDRAYGDPYRAYCARVGRYLTWR